MVVAVLALFVALGAGAYAINKAPRNSVVSRSIKNGQVRTKDLAKNAVKAQKLAAGAVDSSKVLDNSLTPADLANVDFFDAESAVLTDTTADDSVGSKVLMKIGRVTMGAACSASDSNGGQLTALISPAVESEGAAMVSQDSDGTDQTIQLGPFDVQFLVIKTRTNAQGFGAQEA